MIDRGEHEPGHRVVTHDRRDLHRALTSEERDGPGPEIRAHFVLAEEGPSEANHRGILFGEPGDITVELHDVDD